MEEMYDEVEKEKKIYESAFLAWVWLQLEGNTP